MSDRSGLLSLPTLTNFFMGIVRSYFRVQVEGAEHLPRRGRGLIISNHSGVSGFDAMTLQYEVHEATRRFPRVLTHRLWFLTKTTSLPAQKLGFIEATTENGIKHLNKGHLVLLFPEGEHGNFKPSSQAYELQEFKRGFVRMALKTGAPLIPTLILGAEETHINLSQLKIPRLLRGLILPLPLNLLPLPSKWKIIFMEPIRLPYERDAADDRELVHELADEIQDRMQERLNQELARRKSIFV